MSFVMLEVTCNENLACPLIQKHHRFLPGVGVFAGRNFIKGEVIERCITIELPAEIIIGTILDHYAFAAGDDNTGALVLGYAMMYNHISKGKSQVGVNRERDGGNAVRSYRTNGNFLETRDYTLVATRAIKKGDEIYSTYGSEAWFESRGLPYIDAESISNNITHSVPVSVTGDEVITAAPRNTEKRWAALDYAKDLFGSILRTNEEFGEAQVPESALDNNCRNNNNNTSGGCSDNKEEDENNEHIAMEGCALLNTEIIGGKVYAKQYIAQGEVVEICRALLAPPAFMTNSTLAKHLWFSEHGETAMLLLGHGSVYNAVSQDDLNSANLIYEWYSLKKDASSGGGDEDSTAAATTTTTASVAYWDDLVNDETAMVLIRARKDIIAGQEMIVPLIVEAGTGRRRVFNRLLPAADTIY